MTETDWAAMGRLMREEFDEDKASGILDIALGKAPSRVGQAVQSSEVPFWVNTRISMPMPMLRSGYLTAASTSSFFFATVISLKEKHDKEAGRVARCPS